MRMSMSSSIGWSSSTTRILRLIGIPGFFLLRKVDGERTPDVHNRIDADEPPVHLDIFFCDREREPDTVVFPAHVSRIRELEWFKNLVELGVGDADSVVPDRETVHGFMR